MTSRRSFADLAYVSTPALHLTRLTTLLSEGCPRNPRFMPTTFSSLASHGQASARSPLILEPRLRINVIASHLLIQPHSRCRPCPSLQLSPRNLLDLLPIPTKHKHIPLLRIRQSNILLPFLGILPLSHRCRFNSISPPSARRRLPEREWRLGGDETRGIEAEDGDPARLGRYETAG